MSKSAVAWRAAVVPISRRLHRRRNRTSVGILARSRSRQPFPADPKASKKARFGLTAAAYGTPRPGALAEAFDPARSRLKPSGQGLRHGITPTHKNRTERNWCAHRGVRGRYPAWKVSRRRSVGHIRSRPARDRSRTVGGTAGEIAGSEPAAATSRPPAESTRSPEPATWPHARRCRFDRLPVVTWRDPVSGMRPRPARPASPRTSWVCLRCGTRPDDAQARQTERRRGVARAGWLQQIQLANELVVDAPAGRTMSSRSSARLEARGRGRSQRKDRNSNSGQHSARCQSRRRRRGRRDAPEGRRNAINASARLQPCGPATRSPSRPARHPRPRPRRRGGRSHRPDGPRPGR